MERNCDSLSTLLWKKAYPDVDHEQLIEELFGTKSQNRGQGLVNHLQSIPVLNKNEMGFNPEYTYKREETLKFFVN